jgi:hypothetical protein
METLPIALPKEPFSRECGRTRRHPRSKGMKWYSVEEIRARLAWIIKSLLILSIFEQRTKALK